MGKVEKSSLVFQCVPKRAEKSKRFPLHLLALEAAMRSTVLKGGKLPGSGQSE